MFRKRSASFDRKVQGPFKRQRTSTMTKAEVLRIVRANSDKKQMTEAGQTTVNTTGIMLPLVNMIRGDNMKNEYNGSWINLQWLRFRSLTTVADTEDTVRTIVLQWKGANPSGSLTPGLILDMSSGVKPILAPYSAQNRDLFTILSDITVNLDSQTNSEISQNIFIPGKRLRRVHFNRTNDTVLSDQLYLVSISNSAVTPSPPLDWAFEGWFTDDI